MVLLFLNSLRKLFNEWSPHQAYTVWDSRLIKGKKNFRRDVSTYKSDRDKDKIKDVYEYDKLIRSLCSTLGVQNIYPGILEADDVISYMCKHYLIGSNIIISTDQDMLQLINFDTSVYNPIKKITYTYDNFRDYFPVELKDYLTYKALIGDKSDNIQGVAGIGPKRAVRLITEGVYNSKSLTSKDISRFEHNLDMIDLSKGWVHHPEEKSIYEYQLKESSKSTSSHTEFQRLCADNNVDVEYDFSMFFKDSINSAVVDALR